jgi:hypothetical protein
MWITSLWSGIATALLGTESSQPSRRINLVVTDADSGRPLQALALSCARAPAL